MPDPAMGILAGASIVGSVGGAAIGSSAASKAAKAQVSADMAGIEEQRRQFDALQALLKPYVDAGTPALGGLMDLAGLSGDVSQAGAIAEQEASPLFQGLLRTGEDAILQNASATGGLRGGNVQGALAQFRPQLLNQFIDQQFSRLGGIATMGQNSAAGVGSAGMASANNISQLLSDSGAARAGGAIAQGNAWGNVMNLPVQLLALKMGMGGKGI